jgi:hypothetical protein
LAGNEEARRSYFWGSSLDFRRLWERGFSASINCEIGELFVTTAVELSAYYVTNGTCTKWHWCTFISKHSIFPYQFKFFILCNHRLLYWAHLPIWGRERNQHHPQVCNWHENLVQRTSLCRYRYIVELHSTVLCAGPGPVSSWNRRFTWRCSMLFSSKLLPSGGCSWNFKIKDFGEELISTRLLELISTRLWNSQQ